MRNDRPPFGWFQIEKYEVEDVQSLGRASEVVRLEEEVGGLRGFEKFIRTAIIFRDGSYAFSRFRAVELAKRISAALQSGSAVETPSSTQKGDKA
jgi:hypothetical protein